MTAPRDVGGPLQHHTIVIYFPGSVSKDRFSGMHALECILNPERDPMAQGVSVFKRLFPNIESIVLSGDSGNGFRSYSMNWSEYSYALSVSVNEDALGTSVESRRGSDITCGLSSCLWRTRTI